MNLFERIQDVSFLEVPYSFVQKRNARIKSRRLPSDFFNLPMTPRPTPSYIEQDLSARDIKTPSFRCRSRCSSSMQETIDQERKVETARVSLEKSFEVQDAYLTPKMVSKALKPVQQKGRTILSERYSMSLQKKNVRFPKILKKALLSKGQRA